MVNSLGCIITPGSFQWSSSFIRIGFKTCAHTHWHQESTMICTQEWCWTFLAVISDASNCRVWGYMGLTTSWECLKYALFGACEITYLKSTTTSVAIARNSIFKCIVIGVMVRWELLLYQSQVIHLCTSSLELWIEILFHIPKNLHSLEPVLQP